MAELVGACIFAQSGGPTAVINATAAGVFAEAFAQKRITKVYGASHGIVGILNDRINEIELEDKSEIELLRYTPSSALGSSRYKLKKEKDLERILEIFKKYNVRYFFFNGGNDSMDTCNKVSKYLLKCNYPCRVIGIPKTIDNDLVGTDHCPGFGSAAKFVAASIMNIYADSKVYDAGQVTIVEIMGRDAGWLAASSALAGLTGHGPHLVYLPEQNFCKKEFIEAVREVCDGNKGRALIAVSEGIHTADGKLVSCQAVANDSFGHPQLGGVAVTLERIVKEAFPGKKTRAVELSILQRSSAFIASATDQREAFEVGRFAVKSACEGHTDKMAAFKRTSNTPYQMEMVLVDVGTAANAVKRVPAEWILPKNRGLTKEFFDYALPLIEGEPKIPFVDGLPRFARLKKIKSSSL